MVDKDALEMIATDLIARLLKVVDEQKQTIVKYEGAIEGIKLFLQELKLKMDAQANGQLIQPKRSAPTQSQSEDAIGE